MNEPKAVLVDRILGGKSIPLSENDFRKADAAKEFLLSCIHIEESYEILILSYLDYEETIMRVLVGFMLDRPQGRFEFDSVRRKTDRALVSLLAAGEMYGSHIARILQATFGRTSSELNQFKSAQIAQRGKLVGFEAIERLRDAVLHRSLPVTSWTQGSQWIDIDEPAIARMEHTYAIYLEPSVLRGDRKVPSQLVDRLEGIADKHGHVSWTLLVRQYVEGMSQIHKVVRDIISDNERTSRTFIDELIDRFKGETGKSNPHSLGAISYNAEGKARSEIALQFDFEERIEGLRNKNRPLVNLHKRRAVGE